MFDLLIQNGTVIDGTGGARRRADVGIRGERIEAVDALPGAQAAQTIDASGMIVAPGFIDMHSHADYTLLLSPTADSKVAQGVTFELVGNCGLSPAPVDARSLAAAKAYALPGDATMDWEWDSFESFLDRLRGMGTSVNVAALVGQGTIRSLVMGEGDDQPDGEAMERMRAEVKKAMRAGAYGLSTGLIYPPSVYAGTDEIVALAECAAREGGIYTSHVRGEADSVLEAVDEAIEIGRRAHIPVEISHLKAQKRANWPKMPRLLEKIERACVEGLDVSADMYPYPASSTSLSALLKPWTAVGGKAVLLQRLVSPERERILRELDSLEVEDGPGFWERTVVSFCPGRAENDGMSIAAIAAREGMAPEQAVIELLLATGGMAEMVQFLMSEENVELGLSAPFVTIGSDGEGRAAEGLLSEGKPHPRNYGTFPRVLGYYCRERGLWALEEAVRKMTGAPAQKLGLGDRGLVRAGYYADLTVFQAEAVRDRATFTQPHQYPQGIPYVIVNGQAVIWDGKHTRARSGKVVVRG